MQKETQRKWHVIVRLPVTQEDIDNVVTTAFEGGINYWCSKALPVKEFTTYRGQEHLDKHQWYTSPDEPWEYQLYDAETDEKFVHSAKQQYVNLSRISLLVGLQLYAEWHIENGQDLIWIDSPKFDVDCADMVIQFAVFGEVIYG